ncbi:endolytic transglycosylase MltG [Bacillota bacterium LX-D]|nr:endolytic transglycosylase MltG [Bacillota bacterium LX-D]
MFYVFSIMLFIFIIFNSLGPAAKYHKEILVHIPKGSSTLEIAILLEKKQVIKSNIAFVAYYKIFGKDKKLKAGYYMLDSRSSTPQIIDKLNSGDISVINVTIPEGYNVKQISDVFSAKGIINKSKFLTLAKNGDFKYPFLPTKNNKNSYRLEGFLFPDTYQIKVGSTEKEIIEMMLDRFAEVFTKKDQEKAARMNLSSVKIITLASIIEKEAKLAVDRPVISSVFHNRLNKGMRLESCATIQYLLGKPKTKLSYDDLKIVSPYNTYLHKGLPPGPIASPGKAAIRAALYPARTDYLYFLAKSNGAHVFSKTLEEHVLAKEKYIK